MNIKTRDVTRAGRSIQLSVKKYDLLNFLMRRAGPVQARPEIMKGVWGENFFDDDNLLDVYVRYLRQKIERKDQPSLNSYCSWCWIHSPTNNGLNYGHRIHSLNSASRWSCNPPADVKP